VEWLAVVVLAPNMAVAETPRLFELTAPFRVFSARADSTEPSANALPKDVLFMQRMDIRTDAFGSDLLVGVAGKEEVARFVDSYQRDDGMTYIYATGEPGTPQEMRWPVTTFSDPRLKPMLHPVVDGQAYYAAPEDGHYTVTRMAARSVNDVTHSIDEVIAQMPLNARITPLAAVSTAKRRAASCGCTITVPLVSAVDLTYLAAVGDKDGVTALDRVKAQIAHIFDRINATHSNSGVGDVRLVNLATTTVQVPQGIGAGLYAWASDHDGPVNQFRRAKVGGVTAKGTILFYQNGAEAIVNSPDPSVSVVADANVAIVGNYYADWDDGYIWLAIHEVGHMVDGIDHDPAHALFPLIGPWAYRHSACDCAKNAQFAVSYNACGRELDRMELFPGAKVKAMGYDIDLSVSDAVRAARGTATNVSHAVEY
jgi:hypothetical protein